MSSTYFVHVKCEAEEIIKVIPATFCLHEDVTDRFDMREPRPIAAGADSVISSTMEPSSFVARYPFTANSYSRQYTSSGSFSDYKWIFERSLIGELVRTPLSQSRILCSVLRVPLSHVTVRVPRCPRPANPLFTIQISSRQRKSPISTTSALPWLTTSQTTTRPLETTTSSGSPIPCFPRLLWREQSGMRVI
jgi:hypothetical protein